MSLLIYARFLCRISRSKNLNTPPAYADFFGKYFSESIVYVRSSSKLPKTFTGVPVCGVSTRSTRLTCVLRTVFPPAQRASVQLLSSRAPQDSHLSTLFDALRQGDDIQGQAQFLPRLDIVHVLAVQTVELMHHCVLELSMDQPSLLVVGGPTEEVAHSVELAHD